jgi:molybdopterin converting factor small subunit
MVKKIKLFASAKKIAGGKYEVTLEFLERTTITVTDLRERVLQIYPKLAQIPFVFAINYKIAWESEANTPVTSNTTSTLTPYDEIALRPPISAG